MAKLKRTIAAIFLSLFVLTQVQVPDIQIVRAEASTEVDDGYDYSDWKDSKNTNVTVVQGADTVNVYTWKPDDYKPRLTEVYSINASLKGKCYYMPSKEDIPNLKEYIQQQGKFVDAYMGYYDLSNGINPPEEVKPQGSQSRALEVLGYDFLLSKEEYKDKIYNPTLTPQTISYATAIMDIYKAMGAELYDVSLFMSYNENLTMKNSPAVKVLPSYVTSIDNTDGRTDVFVTRTNPNIYMAKAQKDMNISSTSNINRVITYGEFFVLLTRMMKFYGEPVMSELEMNQLLQVYGSDVPLYLTDTEKDAFLYLKSRGVLNVDVRWEDPLLLADMLDVLMCVKDKDSRTDYKKIQVTVSLDDELIQSGYFPRDLNISYGNDFVQSKSDYDYSQARAYDYFIAIDDQAIFKDINGQPVQNPYVPSDPSYVSEAYMDSYFAGVVDNKYYHFVIPKSYPYPNVTINTKDSDDRPEYWELPVGGGIYEVSTITDSAVYFDRKPFEEQEFKGKSDIERVSPSTNVNARNTGSTNLLYLITKPFFQKVNAVQLELDDLYSNGVRHTLTVPNALQAVRNLDDLLGDKSSYVGSYSPDTDELTLLSSSLTVVQLRALIISGYSSNSSISANASNTAGGGDQSNPITQSIGRVEATENQMIDYKLLTEKGLLEETLTMPKPNPDTSVLTLYSKYGAVKLNNKTHEVCVGNVLYKVDKNTKLYFYKVDEVTNEQQLFVDFRAVYGWSRNILEVNIVGTGSAQTINVADSMNSDYLKTDYIHTVNYSTTTSYSPPVFIRDYLKEDHGNDARTDKFIMSSTYPLANWFIYEGEDGPTEDYLFVFYLKEMFTSLGMESEMPDDYKLMENILGYKFESSDWCVRAFKLRITRNNKPGQVNYLEDVGYAYNIPVISKTFDIRSYLRGDTWLPIVHTKTQNGDWKIKNINIGINKGFEYGSMPWFNAPNTENSEDYEPGYVYSMSQLLFPYGELSEVKRITTEEVKLADYIPAPAGVSAFLAGMDEGAYSTLESLSNATSDKLLFLGTTQVMSIKNSSTDENSKFLELSAGSKDARLPNSTKAYKSTKVGLDRDIYVLISGEVKLSKSTEMEKEKLDISVSVNAFDKFVDYSGLKLKDWINFIDNGTSVVIYITLTLLPQIFLTLITILLGLSLISGIKVVRNLARRYIDPVEILTFGHMTIEQLDFRKMVLSIILAYIVFALVLDGNLIRILSWLVDWYNEIILLFKGGM